jgi:hypothetical protein
VNALERLEELLAQRATEGLSPAETAELERLLERHSAADFERAAAALHVASLPPLEPMPAALRARVQAEGERIVAGRRRP